MSALSDELKRELAHRQVDLRDPEALARYLTSRECFEGETGRKSPFKWWNDSIFAQAQQVSVDIRLQRYPGAAYAEADALCERLKGLGVHLDHDQAYDARLAQALGRDGPRIVHGFSPL